MVPPTAHKTSGQRSEAQREQAKLRRKRPAEYACEVSGCDINFTTNHRRISKFPPFPLILSRYSASSTLFLKSLISQLAGHLKGFHLGIKDNICTWPGCRYATAYPSDLRRHTKVHTKKKKVKHGPQARTQDGR